jgi:hypothetical protein
LQYCLSLGRSRELAIDRLIRPAAQSASLVNSKKNIRTSKPFTLIAGDGVCQRQRGKASFFIILWNALRTALAQLLKRIDSTKEHAVTYGKLARPDSIQLLW